MNMTSGRVAVISHAHPQDSRGGAEIAAYSLYCGLKEVGVDAIFVAARPKHLAGTGNLRSGEFAISHDPAKYDFLYQLSSSNTAQQLCRIFEEQDVVIANFHHFWNFGINNIEATLKRSAARGVFTFHEYLAICANDGQMITRPDKVLCQAASPEACAACFPLHSRTQFAIRQGLMQRGLLEAKGFVSPSRFLADRMVAWGIPEARIRVIENGVKIRPAASRPVPAPNQAASSSGRRWTFGYFGQITPYKGVDTILAAVETIAAYPALADQIMIRVHGNFVGHAEQHREWLEQSIAKYPFISYHGPYNNNDVGQLMGQCDYVMVPSIWWENSPVVIQEAYLARRPVICSGIGGMGEKVVDGVTGLHFRPGDANDLARIIGQAADQDLYETLCGGLPTVKTHIDAATAYMSAFEAFCGTVN